MPMKRIQFQLGLLLSTFHEPGTEVQQVDDAYWGGELTGGTAGRDSENRVALRGRGVPEP